MDKKIIIGFVITVLVSVLASVCVTKYHRGYGSMSKCASMEEKNYADKMRMDEKTMGHKMGSMEHQMMGMTDAMKNKTGDELDKIFLADMIVHHQGAVDMAEMLLKETKRPELQKMATDIITAQKAEIAQMKAWQTEWFSQK